MSDNHLTILVVEPGKPPYPRQIPDTLQAMQEIVGGDIDATYPYEDPVALILTAAASLLACSQTASSGWKTGIRMMLCAAPFSSPASAGKPLCL